MKCTDCRDEIALLDSREGVDGLSEEAADHVRCCSACQARIREYRRVQRLISDVPQPAVPAGLVAQIMIAAEQQTISPWVSKTMFGMFVEPARPRLLAHLCGLIFTVSTFLAIITPFNPKLIAPQRPDNSAIIYLNPSSSERAPVSPRWNSFRPVPAGLYLPRLSPSANLDQFTDDVHRTLGVEGVVMLAEVDERGNFSIVQMLSPREEPVLRGRLDNALRRSLFVPARLDERPARPRFVLLTYWMNVKG